MKMETTYKNLWDPKSKAIIIKEFYSNKCPFEIKETFKIMIHLEVSEIEKQNIQR